MNILNLEGGIVTFRFAETDIIQDLSTYYEQIIFSQRKHRLMIIFMSFTSLEIFILDCMAKYLTTILSELNAY